MVAAARQPLNTTFAELVGRGEVSAANKPVTAAVNGTQIASTTHVTSDDPDNTIPYSQEYTDEGGVVKVSQSVGVNRVSVGSVAPTTATATTTATNSGKTGGSSVIIA